MYKYFVSFRSNQCHGRTTLIIDRLISTEDDLCAIESIIIKEGYPGAIITNYILMKGEEKNA